MISYVSHVMTLANSIIGVSVLAMPFCFKQCGIILAIVVLVLCSLLSRLACHFLIKSAVMSRRRNYEFLAFHAFGPMGKFLVELFVIGFLLGTCIAFFVVIGDLGPQIIGKMLYKKPEDIRLSFLITTGALIVLPLGLLRNIDSLASICTVTIGFYLCLVLKVITDSMEHIFRGDWYDNVNYWRPAGILQCLPIFSMALFCQTQLFEIYESIPNVTLEKMNIVVKGAINICILVYISVGVFGYVGFCMQSFSGNILLNFEPSMTSDVIKIGFVLSVVFSFPLVIFPCRASLNSLLFRRAYMHESSSNYIPEIRFRCLTFIIVTVSLITGLLMPNIEFVLGFVGSTIGVMICLIFPAGFFITISTKNTNERLMAQVILFIGMWIMILGSYANLYAAEESTITKISIATEKPFPQINTLQLNLMNERPPVNPEALGIMVKEKEKLSSVPKKDPEKSQEPANTWQQANAVAIVNAVESPVITNQVLVEPQKKDKDIPPNPSIPKIQEELSKPSNQDHINPEDNPVKDVIPNAEEKIKEIEEKEKINDQQINENLINSDAIKKEESEIAAAADQTVDSGAAQLHKEQIRIKDTLEQHKIETIELLKEQKVLLEDIKKQKEEFEMEKKLLKNMELEKVEGNVLVKDPIVLTNEGKVNVEQQSNDGVQSPLELSNNQLYMENNKKSGREIINEKNIVQNNFNKTLIAKQNEDEKLRNISISSANLTVIESRGPILNALTNRTVSRNISTSQLTIEDVNKNEDLYGSKKMQYALPIALKLINQTKEINNQQTNSNKSTVKESVVQRDILEDHAREKRETNEQKSIPILVENDLVGIHNEKRTLNQTSIVADDLIDEQKINQVQSTTELIIIKTNAYLADQKFPNIALHLDEGVDGDYQIVKKRDLKALKSDKTRE